MKLYNSVKDTKEFQEYLKLLPEKEREQVEESLNKICEEFQQKVLNPLETLIKS